MAIGNVKKNIFLNLVIYMTMSCATSPNPVLSKRFLSFILTAKCICVMTGYFTKCGVYHITHITNSNQHNLKENFIFNYFVDANS